MERIAIAPRQNWQDEITKLGYSWHTAAGTPNWHEAAYYHFSPSEVTALKTAAETIHRFYIDATQHVIDRRLWPLIGIEPAIGDKITKWWDGNLPTLYGRMDFRLGSDGNWKLLDYNADAPGNVFETAIVQRNWLQQRMPDAGQCNDLAVALTARWHELLRGRADHRLHIVADAGSPEDIENARFIGECAAPVGFQPIFLTLQQIGQANGVFYDMSDQEMVFIYKHYPWELLIKDAYGEYINPDKCWWIEPAWKMAFQCKGMLSVLWDLCPEHVNLLPASTSRSSITFTGGYVRKPFWGRRGENIQIISPNDKIVAETRGSDGGEGYIYQQYAAGPAFDGHNPVVGVWIVLDKAVALSVREDTQLITDNNSRFVPHIV